MAKLSLTDRVKEGVLFLDGAMGTQLMSAGIEVGGCNDYQNIASPETVLGVGVRYFAAGCDCVLTNTLGATSYALSRHGHGDKVEEINLAGAQLGRKAAGDGGYVLGDMGPCGDFIEPLGTVKPDELQAAFAVATRNAIKTTTRIWLVGEGDDIADDADARRSLVIKHAREPDGSAGHYEIFL